MPVTSAGVEDHGERWWQVEGLLYLPQEESQMW